MRQPDVAIEHDSKMRGTLWDGGDCSGKFLACSPQEASNCRGNNRTQPIHNTECSKGSWLLLLGAGLPKVGFADASIGVEQSTKHPAPWQMGMRDLPVVDMWVLHMVVAVFVKCV